MVLWKNLINFYQLKIEKNVEGLRLYYNQIESCVPNLNTLGVETNAHDSLVIGLLLLTGKHPDDLRLRIARKLDNNVLELSKL